MNTPTRDPAAQVDGEVFGRLYARHAGQVFGFVLSRVRDRHLAEDLTAETFVRALRATQSASAPVANPRAWLDTIALNLVRSHFRRSGVQREVTTGAVPDVGSCEVGPERSVIDWETTEELHRAFEQLSPSQRECIGLRFWRELPVAQAAAAMGCSVGTVKSQTHRAVGKLRAAMTADSPPAPAPRDTADQVASARDAVTEVHHWVTDDDRQAAGDRAQRVARWHTEEQAGAKAQGERALTGGVA